MRFQHDTYDVYKYCTISVTYYSKREYSPTNFDSYDYDNYAYSDSRECIERYLNHSSFSIESLIRR